MTSTPQRAASVHHAPILVQLHHDWNRISIRAAELGRVRAWGLPGAPVDSLDEVLERAGYRQPPADWWPSSHREPRPRAPHHQQAHGEPNSNDYLLRLVTTARHDDLAARIVLQRILPALCAIARRHSTGQTRRHELIDELVANAWPVIRSYPCERRPRLVAANLVRDTGFQTLVRPIRRRSATAEVPTSHDGMGDPAAVVGSEPLEELIELVREARQQGGISDQDVDFISQLVTHGRPENLALLLEVTPRTVRNHRDAVVHRLRNVALAA